MARKQQPRFLRLDEIEAEGADAVDETARAMLDDILRDGGRINWSALGRAGPTVARSLLRLSVRAARRDLMPQAEPPKRGSSAPRPTKRKAPKTRVSKNWRDLRTEPSDPRWSAFLQGTIGAAVTSLIAAAIIRLFHL